jgi:hypothetical protein
MGESKKDGLEPRVVDSPSSYVSLYERQKKTPAYVDCSYCYAPFYSRVSTSQD